MQLLSVWSMVRNDASCSPQQLEGTLQDTPDLDDFAIFVIGLPNFTICFRPCFGSHLEFKPWKSWAYYLITLDLHVQMTHQSSLTPQAERWHYLQDSMLQRSQ